MQIGLGIGTTSRQKWVPSLTEQIRSLLFRNGEQGAWYDPSDMSTLFQDSAGTVPVTAVEQPVGRMLDKSGRGNHATQATTTKRPVLKIDAGGCYYLSFDGVDDCMQTGNIDFTGTDKMTVWAGVSADTSKGQSIVTEFGSSNANPGTFSIVQEKQNSSFFARSTVSTARKGSYQPLTMPAVLSGQVDFSAAAADEVVFRGNGAPLAININPTEENNGTFTNSVLYIGARAGTKDYLKGSLYPLIVRGAQSSLSQIEVTEAYIKQKMRLP